jgi:dienelactone hydrolase
MTVRGHFIPLDADRPPMPGSDGGRRPDGAAASRRAFLTSAGLLGLGSASGCLSDTDGDSLAFEHLEEVRSDEVVELVIDGFPPDTGVEVTAEIELTTGTARSPTVTLEADDGRLDLAETEVVDGDPFDGVDVWDGLNVPPSVALLQFVDDLGETYSLPEEHDVTYHVEPQDEGTESTSTSLIRTYPGNRDPQRSDPADLIGEVFEPPEGESGPGIVVLHGADGSPSTETAGALAANGFTAFALQYTGAPGLPSDVVEVPVEYVGDAIDWLAEHETVDGERVGIYGVSKGGELGLLAGSVFESVGAVVSIVGNGVVWEGQVGRGTPETSSWTYEGEPVPYVPWIESAVDPEKPVAEQYGLVLEATSSETIDTATIPVERIDGPVLLVSGGEDATWESELLQGFAERRLEEHGHQEFEHLVFEEAGHAIVQLYLPVDGTYGEELGGSPSGNAEAAHRHWPDVIGTFETLEST